MRKSRFEEARKTRRAVKKKVPNVKRSKARSQGKRAPAKKRRARKPETPLPPVRGWSLNTLESVRRRLAQLATDISRGAVEDKKARTLCYVLNSVAMILKAEKELDIEDKLLALEKAAGIVPRFETTKEKGDGHAEELVIEN